MITIKSLEFKKKYAYTWLRYITGVNLAEHCLKCLRGRNDERVNGSIVSYSMLKLPDAKYYYLCAGTNGDNNWKENVHIAFKHSEGSTVMIDNEFVLCEIENAIEYPINNTAIDYNLPHANEKQYNTCRNWWFANQVAPEFDRFKLF